MRTVFFAIALLLAAPATPAVAPAAEQGQVYNASRYTVVFTVYGKGREPDVFSLGPSRSRALAAGTRRVFGVGVANGKKCSARTDASETDRLTFQLSRDAKCRFER